MLEWLGNMFRGRTASAQPSLSATQQARIVAKYENAQTTDENVRNWWGSDFLSAKAANSFEVRRSLKARSRNEVSNNPYMFGIATSNADDLVNTGPTLQCLRSSASENAQIERAWSDWWAEIEGVEKLRTVKLAKTVDGEGILVCKTVPDMENPVKIYPVDVESDQLTTPMPELSQALWVDGLVLHPVTGRPTKYEFLQHHPGDFFITNFNPLKSQKIDAKHVIHWFQKFRPGQVRGVPLFTPSLDLFVELRAFRKAVLAKMNQAANLTAVLETPGPADPDDGDTATPFEHIPIDRGTMTTIPGGSKLNQFQTGEAGTSYEMFQEKCLGEACRPLSYPLNLALGTSQKFNFSSARLDHINYRNSLDVERSECDRVVLDKLFRVFIEEARLVPGLLPASIKSAADVPHDWYWPGYAPLDPQKDAEADHMRLQNGTETWQQFWSARGYDWKEIMEQQALEREEIERLGLEFGEPKEAVAEPEDEEVAASRF